jgi:hypothetical protein
LSARQTKQTVAGVVVTFVLGLLLASLYLLGPRSLTPSLVGHGLISNLDGTLACLVGCGMAAAGS